MQHGALLGFGIAICPVIGTSPPKGAIVRVIGATHSVPPGETIIVVIQNTAVMP
jgi:hypothetical protein